MISANLNASTAQIHSIIATRWSRRLAPAVVIAANEGYLLGRVNFATRSHSDVDLLQSLEGLSFTPPPESEYANGHPRATGGSLPTADFERFIDVLRARADTRSGLTRSRAAARKREPRTP